MSRSRLARRLSTLLVLLLAGVAGIVTVVESASAGPAVLARPAADDPGLRGATAPVAGVVPGLTGRAAEEAAGSAAQHFRTHAAERIARSQRSAAAVAATAAAATTIHDAWGTFLTSSASHSLQATHSVFGPATTRSPGDYVYAPTALPGGTACIELTTAITPQGSKLWAWDWCGGRDGIGKVVNIDAAFLATYTTMVNGRSAYSMQETQVSTSPNVWTVYLFNYQTHAWDTFYTGTGAKSIPGAAWDFYEVYTDVDATSTGSYCRDLVGRSFEATGIKVLQGGVWKAADNSNSRLSSPVPGSRLGCPALKLSIVRANDAWLAEIGGGNPPPPPAGKSYEAESAENTLGGQAAARTAAGASGGAVVGYVGNGAANYLQFANVMGGTAGSHKVTVYYASAAARATTISVNGGAAVTVNPPSTGGWDTIGSITVNLTLTAGANTLRFGNPTGWAPDFDRIVVD